VTFVTKFQFASTARAETVKAVPAVWFVGAPVLPVVVPRAAISPGDNSCNFTKLPALMAMDGLALSVLVPSVMSVAVSVALPAVLKVTLNVLAPEIRGALAGNAEAGSVEVIATVSVTVFTWFQLASTPRTVTVKAVPAVCEVGVPVLPLVVPGAAVSPGTTDCNFTNAPGVTVIDGLVL